MNAFDMSDVEIITIVDDDDHPEHVEYSNRITIIHKPTVKPISVGNLFHECYKLSKGDWIFFGNDDSLMETPNWDVILRSKIQEYPDGLALFWPDDDKFGANLSCFPIVSRKVLEGIQFFPTPYRRYKVDDTIYSVFPFNRRIYLPEIKFVHSNPIYTQLVGNTDPNDDGAIAHDNLQWVMRAQEREDMRRFFAPVRKHVKVLIGASVGDVPRRSDFYDYMNALEKPPESMLMYSHERSPARARNEIIQQALDYGCTHVLLVDDDQVFRPNALMLLLEHEADIVSCIYISRSWPHRPLVFDIAHENGECRFYPMNSMNGKRLVPIVAAGFGFILMKTSIFSKLEKPYVRLGELDPQEWCDDIGFFKRVREAGIKSLYCDTECRVGHIGSMIVWPNKVKDKWFAGYDTGSGSINVPFPEVTND